MTTSRTADYQRRLAKIPAGISSGKMVAAADAPILLDSLLAPGDRVLIEGDNQKQARFLAGILANMDPARVHDLHMLMSAFALDEHVALFERGIARRLDCAFAGPQSAAFARLLKEGRMTLGALHTYNELYSRYCTDLCPDVALLAGETADAAGNVFLGCNGEETAILCEIAHARKAVVVIQVEKIVSALPRIDIPADRIEYIVIAGERPFIQPLFTRDPARITVEQVVCAMLVIKGVYAPYEVMIVNHGIGFATAAIELLLPTYAVAEGLAGRICRHWVLNPHPTLIPAIEAGLVDSICPFGSEPGMAEYIAAHPDVFFTSHDGTLISNRLLAQVVGHYAIDCFTGATLQIDADGNSSTATAGRIAGFGGAPNLGSSPPGRRHISPAWRAAGNELASAGHPAPLGGRKLTVQVTTTWSGRKKFPVFVDELGGQQLVRDGLMTGSPLMLTGDDITHIVTEHGIAFLLRCRDAAERRAAIRAVAGDTPIGCRAVAAETAALRARGVVVLPVDLGIVPSPALLELLAARSLQDIEKISGGLYHAPETGVE